MELSDVLATTIASGNLLGSGNPVSNVCIESKDPTAENAQAPIVDSNKSNEFTSALDSQRVRRRSTSSRSSRFRKSSRSSSLKRRRRYSSSSSRSTSSFYRRRRRNRHSR